MSTPDDPTKRIDECADREIVEQALGEHRDTMERVAGLSTELSDDAVRALELLDGGDSVVITLVERGLDATDDLPEFQEAEK